jgi:transaldolase
MELFLDSSNLEEIKNASEYFNISGVTTTPTFLRKENIKNEIDHYLITGSVKISYGRSFRGKC